MALLLAGAWAFESALFCTCVAVAFFVAQSLLARENWKRTLLWGFLPVILVLLEHAIYALTVHAFFGKWPLYSVYQEIVLGQSGSGWEAPISPEVFARVPMFVVYFATLVYLWKERVRSDAGVDLIYLHVLFPAATMGVLEGYYFAARSIPAILVTVFFPFAVVVMVSLDRIGRGRVISILAGASFIVMLSACILHLMMPMNSCSPNSTLLRRCLSESGCSPGRLWAEWRTEFSQPSDLDERRDEAEGCSHFQTYVRDSRPIIREAMALATKYAPFDAKLTMLFPMEDSAILFHLGKQQLLRFPADVMTDNLRLS